MFSEGNLVTGIPVAEGEPFDLNGDRFVNQMDIDVWLAESANEAGYGLPFRRGDTELDRDVDITDLNSLSSNFDPDGATAPHSWLEGNFDGDNDIDITDFNFLASNFASDGYWASNAIPEPSSFILCVFGILAVSRFVSRREVG